MSIDPRQAGYEDANSIPLTRNMRTLLARYGFGWEFLDGLTPEEEALIPDRVDITDEADLDDYNTYFAFRMDARGGATHLNPALQWALEKKTGSTLVGTMAWSVDPNITLVDFVKVLEQEGHR